MSEKRSKSSFISPRVLLYIAWRNIFNKKLRTGLTLLGIAISVGAIYFLLSFGIGLRDVVTEQVLGSQSIRTIVVSTPNSRILSLDSDAAGRIKNLPHVDKLSTTFTHPGIVQYHSSESESIIYGIDSAYNAMTPLTIVQGKTLDHDGVNQAIINTSSLKSLGFTEAKDAIGSAITLKIPLAASGTDQKNIDRLFKVVGVASSEGGNEIFIPKFNFEAANMPAYSEIKLLSSGGIDTVPNIRKQIESMGYQTTSPIDTVNQINQIFQFFTYTLFGLGMIGMIVSVIGMFNTLTISLLERTREIGLMIALGARPRDIRRLFTFEAVLLSLLGSIIGIVVASIAGVVVNELMNAFARSRGVDERFFVFAMPLWLIMTSIGLMVVIGLAVVYFPARRAQRITPIDVLRRE